MSSNHFNVNHTSDTDTTTTKCILITGGAKRIGAVCTQHLHQAGYNIIIHYRSSHSDAKKLYLQLNGQRANSAQIIQADLDDETTYSSLVTQAYQCWGRLDALVNNASSFFPTPIGDITPQNWNSLINSNMKAPLFLAQAATPYLNKSSGCIVNMLDVHAVRPMKDHSVYCAAKAGLNMITLSLAKELGPLIRVNGIAPGAILWPKNSLNAATKKLIIERTALQKVGEPLDIAKTMLFLIKDAPYITGQVIAVDGGRSLNI